MKHGEFSIKLINAETKEPMKEFTAPDGKVYVEAEPDLEYFIRCYHHREECDTNVYLEVDGIFLKYELSFFSETTDMGLWKRQNGVDLMSALKFVLKRRAQGSGGSFANMMPPIGEIKATFYETISSAGMEEAYDCDTTGCLNEAFASAPPVEYGKKKAFASVSGSTVLSLGNHWDSTERTGAGDYLGEITIYYTSACGLLYLGLLTPPSATAVSAVNNSFTNAITAPKRKRARIEEPRVVSPISPPGSNVIDLTGDD